MKRALAALGLLAAAGLAAAQDGGYAARFAEQCAPCHGARGTSAQALVPHLGGLPSFYVTTQLFLFREGRRNDHPLAPAMTAIARPMKNADLRGFSDAVAALPPPEPPPAGEADATRLARGRTLAERHHCLGCHGADLAGGRQVPRIGGQREDYVALALKGFRSGARLGYTNAMGEALAGLSEADLDDLAHFVAYAPLGAPR